MQCTSLPKFYPSIVSNPGILQKDRGIEQCIGLQTELVFEAQGCARSNVECTPNRFGGCFGQVEDALSSISERNPVNRFRTSGVAAKLITNSISRPIARLPKSSNSGRRSFQKLETRDLKRLHLHFVIEALGASNMSSGSGRSDQEKNKLRTVLGVFYVPGPTSFFGTGSSTQDVGRYIPGAFGLEGSSSCMGRSFSPSPVHTP
jgi:hypothetical protein